VLGQQRQAVCIDNLCHKIFLLGYYARLACVIQVIVINQLNFTIFFNLNNQLFPKELKQNPPLNQVDYFFSLLLLRGHCS
ncbi:hypothetical protein, partial [Citrobacter sp. FDAARGOS_156]|uniref:hypothetical protein n=1 Tax=Citrobacter sp. FDAARGOS_156 TaxID=1702170 RepID=UPI001F269CB3